MSVSGMSELRYSSQAQIAADLDFTAGFAGCFVELRHRQHVRLQRRHERRGASACEYSATLKTSTLRSCGQRGRRAAVGSNRQEISI